MENQVLNFDIELVPETTISDDAIEIDENDLPETPFPLFFAIEGELVELETYDDMEFEYEEAVPESIAVAGEMEGRNRRRRRECLTLGMGQ